MENLISIVMAVYNCEKYIEETIQSIKKQTYQNWELIIVDDASTDNSLNLVKESIKDISSKAKVISLPQNQGAAMARNAGLNEAKGRYVAYIDADDMWKETKLEEQLKFIQENDYAFTYTSYTYLRENSTKDIRKIPKSLNYKQALKNTAILLSTVIIDTTKIDKKLLEMPNVRRGQDMATWWQILKKGYIAYGFDKRLTIYRRRKNSLSIKKNVALKRTWNLYRNVEKISFIKSLYYFSFYAFNALKKRIF